METKTAPVFFEKFDLNYTVLPIDYPMLPIKALGHQPSVYAQGDTTNLFVTILVPLSAEQMLVQPQNVEMKTSVHAEIYTCECYFEVAPDASATSARLALIKFTIDLPADLSPATIFRVAVYVSDPGLGDNVGKVVMDATMLPTNP